MNSLAKPMLRGYPRADGRKGIRNVVVVGYLVECAHHVARHVSSRFGDREVHLIGFPGCYPNAYAEKMMQRLCTHPNVGAVLLVSLGCESMNKSWLEGEIAASGRPVHTLTIQKSGGTKKTISAGIEWVQWALDQLENSPVAPMGFDELIVGTTCGGSDGTSGLSANPAVGRAFDALIAAGAACVFEETGELIGCEPPHGGAAPRTPQAWARRSCACMEKAASYYATLGYGSFAVGNSDGGLTTIEEKSLGAYAKSGASAIHGLIKPGDVPPAAGLYLLDVVPDGEVRFGFPNINDNAEIVELIACGSHVILFTTGRGSVVGSAVSPVIKVCANPETYRAMEDDMDVDAGRILEGRATLDQVGQEIVDLVVAVGNQAQSKSPPRGTWAPGIHPYLQGIRADRAGMFAGCPTRAHASTLNDEEKIRLSGPG